MEEWHLTCSYNCCIFVDVWYKVLEPISKLRKDADMLKLFPTFLTGEDLFGLTEAAIQRITESVRTTSQLFSKPFWQIVTSEKCKTNACNKPIKFTLLNSTKNKAMLRIKNIYIPKPQLHVFIYRSSCTENHHISTTYPYFQILGYWASYFMSILDTSRHTALTSIDLLKKYEYKKINVTKQINARDDRDDYYKPKHQTCVRENWEWKNIWS